jgi:hypothetical protein
MERITVPLLSLCVLLVSSGAQAQSISITQNTDPTTILDAGSASCSATGVHVDNSYIRRFFLSADHTISGRYAITSVDFGIESATAGTGTTQPLTVNLYSIPVGDTLLFANLMLLGSVDMDIEDGVAQSLTADVSGVIREAVDDDLVVEVFTPDGTADAHMMRIGSNDAGQSQPSYIAAPAMGCDLVEPTDLATVGMPPFTDMHVVMVVHSVGLPLVWESRFPDDMGVEVGTATGSPYDHTPDVFDELYYHLDDGAGRPARIRVVKGGLGILLYY